MLKEKKELELYLEKKIYSIISDTQLCNKIYNYVLEKYNIPKAITSDYLSLRNPLAEANEFILFCLLESIEYVTEVQKSVIPVYYVDKEIKTYSSSKFKVDKIKFPLRFKAIQIAEDQWSASIDFKMLMKLRAAQLIIYNENTQRTMRRIVHGEKEIYKIQINKTSVETIEALYKNGSYIPTSLTMNIPMDSEADFYYDDDKMELVINSMEGFDIIDGYHRYLAACKACDSEKSLNFTMELRIVNFPEDKAQQFIYQEDQKTVMTKTDSSTYDQTKISNRIVERINKNPQSNLCGMISRNDGLINYGDFANLISYFYLNDNKKNTNTNSIILSISNELIENFNILTECNSKFLEKKYSYKNLFIIMLGFIYCAENNINIMEFCKSAETIIKKAGNIDNNIFYKNKPKKVAVAEVKTIFEEVL